MKHKLFINLKMNKVILLSAYLISIIVMIFVYMTGGTTKVYAHLMYIPIAAVSSIYGKKNGIIHAFISGLLLGPFMPLNVSKNIFQEPLNWILRLIIFLTVAFIIGFFSDYNRKHREQITSLLTHDANTGLKNIEAIMHGNNSNSCAETIVLFTVNGFGETMNFFGYAFSNQITNKIAEQLEKILNKYSNVQLYHYSGMQFVLEIRDDSSEVNSDEIISAMEELNKSNLVVNGIPIYLEIQMGIAKTADKNISTFNGVRRALIAYSYARTNNLKSSIFEPSLEEHYRNILNIASGFSEALACHNIKAAYQEILSAETDEPCCIELLARWTKKDGSAIRPDVFIPVIERTELIHELTKYMISRAIDFLKLHSSDNWIVSINFSLKDFSTDNLNYLFQTIEASKVDPERIQIEVVERTIANVRDLFKYLIMLKNHKIKIALDDFGTGYSSYHYLSEIPIDTIKIDKSIICSIDINGTTKSLVKSIVDFCVENEIKTVAEGIETKEISDTCKEIGIDYLQGYYYHKPEIM